MTEAGQVAANFELRARPAMPSGAAAAYTVRDLATLAFYHRRALLVGFFAPLLIALIAIVLTRDVYPAQARLLVLVGREYLPPTETGERPVDTALDRGRALQSEVEILGSNEVKTAAVNSFGAARLYPDVAGGLFSGTRLPAEQTQRAVNELSRRLRIDAQPASAVIQVSYQHRDPNAAAAMVNDVVEKYLERRRQIFGGAQSDFLAEQRDQFQRRLAAADSEIQSVRTQYGIGNLNEQVAAVLNQLAGTQNALRAARERMRGVKAELASLDRRMRDIPAEVVLYTENSRQQVQESARSRLVDLQIRRRELAATYTDNYRPIQDLDRQIAALAASISAEQPRRGDTRRTGRNPVYDQAQSERLKLQTEQARLEAQSAELEQQLNGLSEARDRLTIVGTTLADMERSRDLLEENLKTYARRTEEARITEEANRTRLANVRVIESATPAITPRSLDGSLLAAGLLAGLLLGPIAVVVATLMRETFVLPGEMERMLRVPVLATFPARGGAMPSSRPAGRQRLDMQRPGTQRPDTQRSGTQRSGTHDMPAPPDLHNPKAPVLGRRRFTPRQGGA